MAALFFCFTLILFPSVMFDNFFDKYVIVSFKSLVSCLYQTDLCSRCNHLVIIVIVCLELHYLILSVLKADLATIFVIFSFLFCHSIREIGDVSEFDCNF